MAARLTTIYRVHADAASVEARAAGIAVRQSADMPIESIAQVQEGVFDVRLAVETTGFEIGQLTKILFANNSIRDAGTLLDIEFPVDLVTAFAGPRHRLDGLRRRVGAEGRALTCSSLKPQGMSTADLGRLTQGGIDYIKDDLGLADQRYRPFAHRIRACTEAIAAAGGRTRYVPSLSGHLDQLCRQANIALGAGIDTVLVAPMVLGLPVVHALVREFPNLAFMANPAMAGAARIAPPLLLGKIFRLIGADATIFSNHGDRFGYSPDVCRALAAAALDPRARYAATMPVPAGGVTLARTAEPLDFYGRDSMLLIGSELPMARAELVEEALAFARAVRQHPYR